VNLGVSVVKHMAEHLDIFVCPACGGGLLLGAEKIECRSCGVRYEVQDGIPLLFWPNEWDSRREDVTDRVKDFYEKTPFPNYEGLEDLASLVEKARRGLFARLLNEQIPFNIRILEVGCGTGQLSNFLGIAHRTVFATDISVNSLRLGREFQKRNGLERVGFYQMNLFRPVFKEETFPLIICSGVLHHTSDPFLGFNTISRLVRRGGYILIGLYNRYGRVSTDIRRVLFNVSGGRCKFLDPRLRDERIDEIKRNTWFLDQYKNVHESKHTFGEVFGWFDEAGFDFVNSIPKAEAFGRFQEDEKLFEPKPKGSMFDRFAAQGRLLLTGGEEGGFFVMIGRRKGRTGGVVE
jgi:SAM-dependent methyltransferase/predicted RNA-binding Zn-ribbon protein involved in translation (DUF1610 family)